MGLPSCLYAAETRPSRFGNAEVLPGPFDFADPVSPGVSAAAITLNVTGPGTGTSEERRTCGERRKAKPAPANRGSTQCARLSEKYAPPATPQVWPMVSDRFERFFQVDWM